MDRTEFFALLGERLLPLLRQQGFRGSKPTLRRIDGPVIHVFNMQGSAGAQRCYLNLGAHLDFLPVSPGAAQVDPRQLSESQCAFRARIEPNPSGLSTGWPYGSTQAEAEATIDAIIGGWQSQATEFFERHGRYPDAFERWLDGLEADAARARPAQLLTGARIARQLGHRDRAQRMAATALQHVPPAATALARDITDFIGAS